MESMKVGLFLKYDFFLLAMVRKMIIPYTIIIKEKKCFVLLKYYAYKVSLLLKTSCEGAAT